MTHPGKMDHDVEQNEGIERKSFGQSTGKELCWSQVSMELVRLVSFHFISSYTCECILLGAILNAK